MKIIIREIKVKDFLNLHGAANTATSPDNTKVSNNDMSSYTFKGTQVNHYNIDGATMAKVVGAVLEKTESKIIRAQIRTTINNTQRKLNVAEQN